MPPSDITSPPASSSMDVSQWSFSINPDSHHISPNSDSKQDEIDFDSYFQDFANETANSTVEDFDDEENYTHLLDDTVKALAVRNNSQQEDSQHEDFYFLRKTPPPQEEKQALFTQNQFYPESISVSPSHLQKNDAVLSDDLFTTVAPEALASALKKSHSQQDNAFLFPPTKTSNSKSAPQSHRGSLFSEDQSFSLHEDDEQPAQKDNDVEMKDSSDDEDVENVDSNSNSRESSESVSIKSKLTFKAPGKLSSQNPHSLNSPLRHSRQPLQKRAESSKNVLLDKFQPQLGPPSPRFKQPPPPTLGGPGPLAESPQRPHPNLNGFETPAHLVYQSPTRSSPIRSSACSVASSDSTITLESSRASSPVSRSRSVSPVRTNSLASGARHPPVIGTFDSPVRGQAQHSQPPQLQPLPSLQPQVQLVPVSVSAPSSTAPTPPVAHSPTKIIKQTSLARSNSTRTESGLTKTPSRKNATLATAATRTAPASGAGSPSKHRRGRHGGSLTSSAAQAAVAAAISTEIHANSALNLGPPSTPRGSHSRNHSQSILYGSPIASSPYSIGPPVSPSIMQSQMYMSDASNLLQSVQSSPVRPTHAVMVPLPYGSLQHPPPHMQFIPQLGQPQHMSMSPLPHHHHQRHLSSPVIGGADNVKQRLFPDSPSTGTTTSDPFGGNQLPMSSPIQRNSTPMNPHGRAQSVSSASPSFPHHQMLHSSPIMQTSSMSSPPLIPAPPMVTVSVPPVPVPMTSAPAHGLGLQFPAGQQPMMQQQIVTQMAVPIGMQVPVSAQGVPIFMGIPSTAPGVNLVHHQYQNPDMLPTFQGTVNKIIAEGNHNNQVFMQHLEKNNSMLAAAVNQAVFGGAAQEQDSKEFVGSASLQATISHDFQASPSRPEASITNTMPPVFKFPPEPDFHIKNEPSEIDYAAFKSIHQASYIGPSQLGSGTTGPGHRKSMLPPGTVDKYCKGPNKDGKFECTFENCGKLFRRRYNVRSHIQTHLSDRPYACDICTATFVRPHDLRRHMKCHESVKPYICPCGQSFTRHDALNRHRQRMICIGGLEVPGRPKRIPAKRGRPRKNQDKGDKSEDEDVSDVSDEEEEDDTADFSSSFTGVKDENENEEVFTHKVISDGVTGKSVNFKLKGEKSEDEEDGENESGLEEKVKENHSGAEDVSQKETVQKKSTKLMTNNLYPASPNEETENGNSSKSETSKNKQPPQIQHKSVSNFKGKGDSPLQPPGQIFVVTPRSPESLYSTPLVNSHVFQSNSPPKSSTSSQQRHVVSHVPSSPSQPQPPLSSPPSYLTEEELVKSVPGVPDVQYQNVHMASHYQLETTTTESNGTQYIYTGNSQQFASIHVDDMNLPQLIPMKEAQKVYIRPDQQFGLDISGKDD